jgi:ABC-type proline/glycine betaine transport systems, permease component
VVSKEHRVCFGSTLTHLWVSLLPLGIGALIAIGLARFMPARLVSATNGVLGALYAVPSLALFVALPAILGTSYLGPTNVLIALTLYVIASMFFSARDAFAQVPVPANFIAMAQGLDSWQRFIHVELPLAIPGLIAGLRVAAASTVSMASIGAVVGSRNLGYLFLDGFQRKIPDEIITGLFAIFLIAITFDLLLWLVGKLLTPWSRRQVKLA